MKRRLFLSAMFGTVAGLARAADRFIDNGPPLKTAKPIDNGPRTKLPPPAKPSGYRNPVGHTHTCSAGHTWDHQSNSGHTCVAPVVRNGVTTQCGLYQNVWDNPARMVPQYTYTAEPKPVAPDVPEPSPSVQPYTLGGCANGNCPTTSSRGFGLFRRR